MRVAELAVAAVFAISTWGLANELDAGDDKTNFWSWEEHSAHPRFVMVLGEPTWSTIVLGVFGTFKEQMADEGVHETVAKYVESAIESEDDGCPNQWLVDNTAFLSSGSLLLLGHCESLDELSQPVRN